MNVFLLLGMNNQGGYGVVCKVWIEKFDHIPNTIELAKKTPKIYDKWKAHEECFVEALTCPCKHLGVIKFLAIHLKTHCGGMGACSKKCWITTTNIHPLWIIKCYCRKGGVIWRGENNWNCVKLAWAFMNIMNVIHHIEILHNDLSKDNIMLHFPFDNLDVVHWHVQIGWSWMLTRGDSILYGFSEE